MNRLIAVILSALLATGCVASGKATAPESAQGKPIVSGRPFTAYRNPQKGEAAERTQTGRYSFVANGAEAAQIDPLLAIIDVNVPLSLTSVEDAADYLLRRTGYCLMDAGSSEVRHLYRLPLPSIHRHLGPMSLREAMLAIGGRAYELVVDEVYREVGYRVIATAGVQK